MPSKTSKPKKKKPSAPGKRTKVRDRTKVRYAVVGLGYFAQVAVLPAFAHSKNSKLTALISDDPDKMKKLARKYGVEKTYSYEQYQECLASKEVDAVYIALPNHLHKEYVVRAAKMGVHVLCEKPMAPEVRDCEEMIRQAREHDVRLMIAYRLHFDPGTLKAIEIVNGGKIGEPRHFTSTFSMQVKPGNVRVTEPPEQGGGPLFDIGVYCINAARNLFRDEPEEVFAVSVRKDEKRFREVEEMDSAILRFPGDRVATFTCSFGAADCSSYRVLGTKGDLRVEPAYEYAMPLKHILTAGGKPKETEFRKKDQIAGELVYFSDCVLKGVEPEPSGVEGLADVRVVRALLESARTGRPVKLGAFEKRKRPTLKQAKDIPPVDKPQLVQVDGPSRE
jgi:predicted dehydrogenase